MTGPVLRGELEGYRFWWDGATILALVPEGKTSPPVYWGRALSDVPYVGATELVPTHEAAAEAVRSTSEGREVLHAGSRIEIHDGPRRIPAVVKTLGNAAGYLVVVPDLADMEPEPLKNPGGPSSFLTVNELVGRLTSALRHLADESDDPGSEVLAALWQGEHWSPAAGEDRGRVGKIPPENHSGWGVGKQQLEKPLWRGQTGPDASRVAEPGPDADTASPTSTLPHPDATSDDDQITEQWAVFRGDPTDCEDIVGVFDDQAEAERLAQRVIDARIGSRTVTRTHTPWVVHGRCSSCGSVLDGELCCDGRRAEAEEGESVVTAQRARSSDTRDGMST